MQQYTKVTTDADCLRVIEILLSSVFRREQATVQMILDNFYRIGSRRIFQDYLNVPLVRSMLKPVASVTRPLICSVGNTWFQHHGPRMIAEWLYSQVAMTDAIPLEPERNSVKALPNDLQRQLLDSRLQIKHLQGSLRRRTWMLLTVTSGALLLIGLESGVQ